MIAAVPAVFCLIAPLGWSGCTERSGEEAPAKAAAAPLAAGVGSEDAGSDDDGFSGRIAGVYSPGASWRVDTAETDKRNRYLSAVEVLENRMGPNETNISKHCTGVLVSPRVVLTAASCVCSPHGAAQSDGGQPLVDGKACATAAAVKTLTYLPPTGGHSAAPLVRRYAGAVRVHPAFVQILDEEWDAVSSVADLAVIVLDQPADIPPVELSETDVKAGESLVIVGYGYPPEDGSLERCFSEHRVTTVLKSGGRVAFVQDPIHLYKGVRGGPCLRQTEQGMRLAGILSAGVWREALFTSAYPYREWVRAQIREAGGAAVPRPAVSP